MSDHRDDLPEEPQGQKPDGPVVPGAPDRDGDTGETPFGEETWVGTDPFAIPVPDPAEPIATPPDPSTTTGEAAADEDPVVGPFHDADTDPDPDTDAADAGDADKTETTIGPFHDADTDPNPEAGEPELDATATAVPTAVEDPTTWFREDSDNELTATAWRPGGGPRPDDTQTAAPADETIELPIEMIRGGPEPTPAPPPEEDGFVLRYPEDNGWRDAVDLTLTDVLAPGLSPFRSSDDESSVDSAPADPEPPATDPAAETNPAPHADVSLLETLTRDGDPYAPFAPIDNDTPPPSAAGVPFFDEPEPVSDTLEHTEVGPAAPVPGRSRRATAPRRSWFADLRERLPSWRIDRQAIRRAVGEWWTDLKARWREASKKRRAELKLNRDKHWWRKTLLEVAILYSIVIPIEFAVTGGRIGSFGAHPHPYWLIILPMAGARGVVAGLVAASVGALLFLLGAIQARGGTADGLFTYALMREPILFYAVAFFLGELRDELALRYRKLEQLVEDLRERSTKLRKERDVLAEANRQLEKRIVDDSVQFGNMIVAATRIERSGRAEVFEVALDMVEEHCGAGSSVLMLLDDGSLDYLCHRGWPGDEVAERLAAARGSEFVARAVAEGIAVNGFDAAESPPEEGPLVVAPLIYSGGVVKALLCLDEVPPERLNESTVTVFFGIAEWVSAALARMARGAEMPAPPAAFGSLAQPGAWLGSEVDLGERLRLEVERCTRYGVPASFLAIQATEWKDASLDGRETLDHFMTTHFTGGLRPSDELFRFGYPGCYLLVLAGTDVEGADVVRGRLLRRVEFSPSREVGPIEMFATGPDAEAPDLASLVERVSARFRDGSSLPLDGQCPIDIPTEPASGTIEDFVRRLRMEASLATRNGFDLHVLGIKADAPAGIEPDLLARHVRAAGARTLRPTDGVFPIGPCQVSIICPCTNSEEAATVAHRVARAVRARDPDAPYGDLETQVLSLGAGHPDAGSFLSALAGRGAVAQEDPR